MTPAHPAIDRVVVISDDSTQSGGAAGIALASAEQLAARGIPVTFLTGDAGGNEALRAAGVDLIAMGGAHLMEGGRAKAALRGLYDPRTRDFIAGWIVANDTPRTAYHLHNWHKYLSPAAFSALRRVQGRLLLSMHDYFLVCPNGGYFDFQRQVACELTPLSPSCLGTACDKRNMGHKLWRAARTGVRRAAMDFRRTNALVLAVHDGMIPLLERGGVARSAIRVLRNPVSGWRAERVKAEANHTVFFVGRLELDKGVDVLARSAKAAGADLCVIGDGPLRESLSVAHPEARFLGWRSRTEVADMVGTCRLLVLPSRWRETFGLVALEAAMSGVPVVTSRHALITGELQAIGAGRSCDPADEAALAAMIRELMRDDEAIATMSQAGFAKAGRLALTTQNWVDGLIHLYGEQIGRSGTGASDAIHARPPTLDGAHPAKMARLS